MIYISAAKLVISRETAKRFCGIIPYTLFSFVANHALRMLPDGQVRDPCDQHLKLVESFLSQFNQFSLYSKKHKVLLYL